jgi:hypothetical protein
MLQRKVKQCRVLLLLSAAASTACGTSAAHAPKHHSDANRIKPTHCPYVEPDAIANAKPLTVINENEIALDQGLLEVMIQYDRTDPQRATHAEFDVVRFIPLTPSEFAAAESHKPPNHPPIQSWPDVQVIGADGVAHFAESESSELGSVVLLIARVSMRRDSQAIRVIEAGRAVITLRRPLSPAAIEARLIQHRPLLVAVRAPAQTAPIAVSFIDAQREYPVEDKIYAYERPCWSVIAAPLGLHYHPNTPLRLSLLDLFYRWNCQLPIP